MTRTQATSAQDLEARLARLERRLRTLWHRSYARLARRGEAEAEALRRAKHWARRLSDRSAMNRLAMFLERIERGKILPYLDAREYGQLRALLRRRVPHQPRPERRGEKTT